MSAQNYSDSPNVQSAESFADEIEGGDRGFQYLMANERGRAELMANSSLQKDEWEDLQETVIENRNQDLTLVNYLRTNGLTRSMDLSTMTSIWQKVSEIPDEARVTMNPGGRTNTSDVEYSTDGAPLPVVDMDWHIDRRMLMVSRNQGTGLDTIVPSQLSRHVNAKLEDLVVNGWSTTVDGRTMDGLTNHSSRNTVSGSDWHHTTPDPEAIRTDVISGIEKLEDDEYSPPYSLWLARQEWQVLRKKIADFGSGNPGDTNMRERLMDEFDREIGSINVSPSIASGEYVMFKPVEDVITLGVAEDVQAIEWREPDGWTHHFKIMGAMNVELKDTEEGQMGVVHATGLAG